MILWIARMLLLRRFGGRGLVVVGVVNFLRRRLTRRQLPRGAYQPSQGASQTVHRAPR
jgi:hypothetical protein